MKRTRSYNSFLSPRRFDPPLYGHPLTLPPSPSLTSILRHSSEQVTPDSSSDSESPIAKASADAKRTPLAASKVPTFEYYGFVLYLGSSLAFGIYFLWSFLPKSMLHSLGITYYPERWWAVALPSWFTVLIAWIYFALLGYNRTITPRFSNITCITDDFANISQNPDDWHRGTDAILDVPLGEVNHLLYETE
ncbi:Meiotically up-regulated gene 84 protein [Neolecta irregularis DAH-3]|uniref:Meiotically up-regulated gene 84 protein n=1 Tax=Neolecta irregularis (strain DAH-3) TaxID=1198029 RepID=A0A1U7LIW0_NEOID|nr:Meiotically up-regulated gene 84 protein [Neolecta irregularis DAH-3]|eukprot:OLL22584.1 Meiotically up-regulated gene 84 protein [Neolecta irregularis DAH-3]